MMIWTDRAADEQGPGSVAALNLYWTPRSISQLRALVALRSCEGLDREDLDWFAGVSNGPALMRTLHDDGLYLPCDIRPFVVVGSMPRNHDPAARCDLGQYWLTNTGRQIIDLLRSPAAIFSRRVGGFTSFNDAFTRCQDLFDRPWDEVLSRLRRRPVKSHFRQPEYFSFEGLANHGRSIWS